MLVFRGGQPSFSTNSNSSHSKGFGAELLSDSYGSLGQIRLGPPEGSVQGSTKAPARFQQGRATVPPKFFKFHGVFGSLG